MCDRLNMYLVINDKLEIVLFGNTKLRIISDMCKKYCVHTRPFNQF